MAQKYTVPFYIDESLEDVIAEDESLTKEELLANIGREGEYHNVTVNTKDRKVTGDIESLASFFIMLDGPGPSFEMDSFTEWVVEEGVKVPSKSDFPINFALRVG